MSPGSYRLSIAHGDVQFEAEGDKKFVLDMLKKFKAGELAPSGSGLGTSDDRTGATEQPGKAPSVSEFIRELSVKRPSDIVLAFGYHLEKLAGMEAFTSADINRCYYDAKMESSNTSQMIATHVQYGRMMQAKGKKAKGKAKAYVLTRTGERRIEDRRTKKQEA